MLPPPREAPKVLLKEKEVYRFWIKLHRDFPKVERLGIGKKIEQSFLDLLELTFTSVYLAPEQKVVVLGRAIAKLDNLKFFMQLAWEARLIHTENYAIISTNLEEIGMMLWGWRKGLQEKLQQKTPTK
ncbi:MAG: hypothetical protein A3H52_02030 [Candidatus Zambryskibacteria bacterium RIFCSPLOWO2_02_FULL_39_26]|uniref:Four helix bundle protein n=1 Tax=Candidatus Zambryskibacteria bacterium RIFCSPLOWO2_12_FULL_39_23 TaxID=1802776 RepID=A0A1G2URE3_9BACT|nr:MAG: hypothetical protein A3H52_02030 [Candidatus Zambryskibacteria bacterium RIFCSPLOWO2_02_FULL_39_26]OHB11902.1 MAG: hypothetical protein A3G99_01090 [Candidatus Zambryskibacteria bacterium RIFCSPLOWO2_12_FULL_39_23]